MIEFQEYAGNYYGLSKAEVDASNFVIMDPVGAKTLQVYCKAMGRPCHIIALQASKQEQAERTQLRGDSACTIDERIASNAVAFQHLEWNCDKVCNAEIVEELYTQVATFVLSHIVDRTQGS